MAVGGEEEYKPCRLYCYVLKNTSVFDAQRKYLPWQMEILAVADEDTCGGR